MNLQVCTKVARNGQHLALNISRAFSLSARGLKSVDSDYIIIGGGSAGCVLSNRLSEDPNNSVTLLEAGKSDTGHWDSWKIQMPAALTFNLANDKYNWDFWTTPQKYMNNRSLHCPRGKTLGGSSSLNAMVYVRGNALDFERWSEEGAPGWSYKDVLPYFIKAQSHNKGKSKYRGDSGPLEVQSIDKGSYFELFHAFEKAGVEAGYPYTEDPNGYMQEGFGPMDMTIGKDGKRWNTSNAYLRPAMKRPNLTVQTESKLKKILFDSKDKTKAIGVEYVSKNGSSYTLFAKKEVILSMGAIGSPQALMTSGIGPKQELERHGIETIIDSPQVGQNLQDHTEVYLQYFCKEPVSLYPIGGWRYPHLKAMAGIEWFLKGTGPCASNQFESGGFIRTRAGTKHPDLQYHFIPGCVVGQMEFLPHHGFQVHVGTCRPLSKGEITLNSSDPFEAPIINPNYYKEEDDLRRIRDGLRLTLEIIDQKAFDVYRGDLLEPKPSKVDINNDEQVDEWIKDSSHSAYHPSCTCAMGQVVDEHGLVKGASNLRVVDASIMPSLTSGNLNAPTIMMAEKLADDILGKKLEPIDAEYYVAENWETSQR